MLPYGAKDVISPDGRFLAYFGKEYPTALYVKNLKTGQNLLVAKGTNRMADWSNITGVSFSPDGSRLVFGAGPVSPFAGSIYSVRTDGSNASKDGTGATVLATAMTTPKFKMAVYQPRVSPDGTKVLVCLLVTNGKHDEQGHSDHSGDKEYVGILLADGKNQTPKKLTEGTPLFWGQSGDSIYYAKIGIVYRYDLASKQSKLVLDTSKVENRIGIAGRVPGTDAIFATLESQKDALLTVISLDGTPVSQRLKDFAATIPRHDADGRVLNAIEDAGPHHLILRYKPTLEFLKHGFKLEEVRQLKESGKLDDGSQEVDFP
jgi:dipeptidyl aminopeptidase/acylaminoacyl peptidase